MLGHALDDPRPAIDEIDVRISRLVNVLIIFATLLRMFGTKGEIVRQMTGLNQIITDEELVAVGYQFDASPDELWNPSSGPA